MYFRTVLDRLFSNTPKPTLDLFLAYLFFRGLGRLLLLSEEVLRRRLNSKSQSGMENGGHCNKVFSQK